MDIIVKNRVLEKPNVNVIGDNADYTVNFTFDEEWLGKTKTARFSRKNGQYVDVVLTDDACTIPVEILKSGFISIGVFSQNMTTAPIDIYVTASIKDKTGNPVQPNIDVYSQLLQRIDEISTGGMSQTAIRSIIETQVQSYITENGISVDEDTVADAVADYITNHPVSGGASVDETQVNTLISTFFNAHKEELKGEKGDTGTSGTGGTITDEQITQVTNRVSEVVSNTVDNPFVTAYWKDSTTNKLYLVKIVNGVLTVTEQGSNGSGGDIPPIDAIPTDTLLMDLTPRFDTDGNKVNAHGCGVLEHNGKYYMYGEYKMTCPQSDVICYPDGISCYSSTDLVNWKFEGNVVTKDYMDSVISDLPITSVPVMERPKCLYNAKTKKYVLFFHLAGALVTTNEDGTETVDTSNYSYGKTAVLVSDNPTSGFTYVGCIFADDGRIFGDFAVFVDDDNTGYYITPTNNYAIDVFKLTDDYINVDGEMVTHSGHKREGFAPFKYNDKYYLLTSYLRGWGSSESLMYESTDIKTVAFTTYKKLNETEDIKGQYFGQSTFVLKVDESKYGYPFIALFDEWNANGSGSSDYLWIPLYWDSENEKFTASYSQSLCKLSFVPSAYVGDTKPLSEYSPIVNITEELDLEEITEPYIYQLDRKILTDDLPPFTLYFESTGKSCISIGDCQNDRHIDCVSWKTNLLEIGTTYNGLDFDRRFANTRKVLLRRKQGHQEIEWFIRSVDKDYVYHGVILKSWDSNTKQKTMVFPLVVGGMYFGSLQTTKGGSVQELKYYNECIGDKAVNELMGSSF